MKFRYVGKEEQNLAGVGIVKNGDVIEVTEKQGEGLLKHAPEQFKPVKDKASKPGDKVPADADDTNPGGNE